MAMVDAGFITGIAAEPVEEKTVERKPAEYVVEMQGEVRGILRDIKYLQVGKPYTAALSETIVSYFILEDPKGLYAVVDLEGAKRGGAKIFAGAHNEPIGDDEGIKAMDVRLDEYAGLILEVEGTNGGADLLAVGLLGVDFAVGDWIRIFEDEEEE